MSKVQWFLLFPLVCQVVSFLCMVSGVSWRATREKRTTGERVCYALIWMVYSACIVGAFLAGQ